MSEPVILARALIRKVRAAEMGSRVASCLESGWSELPGRVAVHRIGAFGESVTFGSRSDESLRSCDGTPSADRPAQSWCGHSYGRLSRGRLRDPRLTLGGCVTEDGKPVAFAWIEPGPGTRFVIVRHTGFSEAHESAAGLAVRVASTSGIDTTRLRAVFDVAEHSADGRRLRTYELEATVSG